MSKILVTGGNGQLGKCIYKTLEELDMFGGSENEYIFKGHELDITDKGQLQSFVAEDDIDIIVNCAAYTNVAKAEDEKDKAFLVNATGVHNLGEICSENGIFLITIGTDYVYGNNFNFPIGEIQGYNPLNVYGASKAQGIYDIADIVNLNCLILTVSWLYSEFEGNFVSKMYTKLQNKGDFSVVNDQTGSPTYAMDLARFIVHLIEKNKWKDIKGEHYYNFTNEGTATWYDLAKSIEEYGRTEGHVTPCSTFDFPSNVIRPNYSVLSTKKIKEDFPDFNIPYWRESVKICVEKLKKH